MSRLIKYPIKVQNNVKFSFDNSVISFEGPLGISNYQVPSECTLHIDGNNIFVKIANLEHKAIAGTVKKLIENICLGVSVGFTKKLTLKGVGYKVSVAGSVLKFEIGFSHPIYYTVPANIKIAIEKGVEITLHGNNKHQIGQIADQIYGIKPAERYKGAGIHIVGKYFALKQNKK